MNPTPAGVMELVDVVDSKSTAGDSVPVRVRSPAPRRRGLRIVRDDVFFFQANVIAHSLRRSSFQNRNRFAGFRFCVPPYGRLFCMQVTYRLRRDFYFIAKLIARSRRCSSSPNRNRFAGLRFGCRPAGGFFPIRSRIFFQHRTNIGKSRRDLPIFLSSCSPFRRGAPPERGRGATVSGKPLIPLRNRPHPRRGLTHEEPVRYNER